MKMNLKQLRHEPLVHFLALGLAMFGLYGLVNDDPSAGSDTQIVVTERDVEWLRGNWVRQWNRPPTPEELQSLIDGHVREEVLYREAMAMGLDADDTIVRRRLVQKLDFLSEDVAMQIEPTDVELSAYLNKHAERYRLPPRLSFTHIYFSTDRREDAHGDAERALDKLAAEHEAPARAPERGDRFMLQFDYPSRSSREIGQLFSRTFAGALFQLEANDTWQGPIRSSYGYHVVRVSNREESVLPELATVADRVRQDFDVDRRREASEAFYQSLLAQYEVTIEKSTAQADAVPAVASGGGQ